VSYNRLDVRRIRHSTATRHRTCHIRNKSDIAALIAVVHLPVHYGAGRAKNLGYAIKSGRR